MTLDKMKIKCPICTEVIEETHYGTDLGIHLYWKHKSDDPNDAGDVFRYYAYLIFKIHEKITEFRQAEGQWHDYEVEEILESLLDNEK